MRYGYLPDDFDERDLHLEPSFWQRIFGAHVWEAPAGDLDIFSTFPPVMDQGATGMCTCYATTAALRYNVINNGDFDEPLSVAQLYYKSGELEGNTGDVGRQIRDVVKVVSKNGLLYESLWSADRYLDPPPLLSAAPMAVEYRRVAPRIADIRIALFIGHPVILGCDVFSQFESDSAYQTGQIEMPPAFATPIGGHAILIGSADAEGLGFQNSWGSQWGQQGRGKLPWAYLRYCRDLWVLTMTGGTA